MNGRERIARAMRHEIPDRVPVMCQLALSHYFLNTGIPPYRIWFTSEGFAEALVMLQRRYRFDGILVNIPGRPENALDGISSVEEAREGQLVHWRDGSLTVVPWDDNPYHLMPNGSKPARANFEKLDPDHLEDFHEIVGYVWGVYHIPHFANVVKAGPLSETPPYFFRTIDLVKATQFTRLLIHQSTTFRRK